MKNEDVWLIFKDSQANVDNIIIKSRQPERHLKM